MSLANVKSSFEQWEAQIADTSCAPDFRRQKNVYDDVCKRGTVAISLVQVFSWKTVARRSLLQRRLHHRVCYSSWRPSPSKAGIQPSPRRVVARSYIMCKCLDSFSGSFTWFILILSKYVSREERSGGIVYFPAVLAMPPTFQCSRLFCCSTANVQ